ncbi:ComEA family DNA-binding protein [Agitococcus lubricus]|uniref:Helix-hairpin-helix protein n=1 Tax=Agitococcus lubricus TaxID=1077255 RepID=A0A2T5J275_9GAMM|nr:helix-hairpin-helix domain-containing protein [Agitococcus lubricus]PTQ90621.1 helix-hairpin-helix protein [Agitococcus lubricus]
MLSQPLFNHQNPVINVSDYGYTIDGDYVELRAFIQTVDSDITPVSLQLWASTEPYEQGVLTGVKIAELDCGCLSPTTVIKETVAAAFPAGQSAYYVYLVVTDGVHVLSCLPFTQMEHFVQPTLIGQLTTTVTENAVSVHIEQILNPRDADNLSGTLVLELWSLSDAYQGGAFNGVSLGSVILGTLAGQSSWYANTCSFALDTHTATREHVVLMLREWTGQGYLTRDFREVNLASPAITQEPIVDAVPEEVVQVAVSSPAKRTVTRRAAVKPSTNTSKPSINQVVEAQLAAEKGVSKQVVANILAARPFKKWEEIAKLKGVGEKVLAKLKASFSLE